MTGHEPGAGMLTIGIEDNIVVAALSGEVDLANAGDIGAEISAQVPNAALGLVVDLTDVAYLDSSGIRVLFELAERLQSRQQAMRLVAPGAAPIRRVLGVVALDKTV